MHIPQISAGQLRQAVPIDVAIDALAAAFRDTESEATPRSRYATTSGDLLVMPAWNSEALGVKLVTVNPDNAPRNLPLIHGIYALFDGSTSVPIALMDAEELTRIRTAAMSALATRHLADPDARTLVVFGAGTQADGHIEALRSVRPIDKVTIVVRSRDRASALAEEISDRFGIEASPGSPDAVREADIVCTCTTSPTPVFDGALLGPKVHINAVGSYRPDARELDDEVMARASQVVVESRVTAFAEAGDVVIALRNGALDEARIHELRDLLSDEAVDSRRGGVTVFKSVGMAMEDLAVARAALERVKLR